MQESDLPIKISTGALALPMASTTPCNIARRSSLAKPLPPVSNQKVFCGRTVLVSIRRDTSKDTVFIPFQRVRKSGSLGTIHQQTWFFGGAPRIDACLRDYVLRLLPSGRPNLLRRNRQATTVRPVRSATSKTGSLASKTSSRFVHAGLSQGGRVPRARWVLLIFSRVSGVAFLPTLATRIFAIT